MKYIASLPQGVVTIKTKGMISSLMKFYPFNSLIKKIQLHNNYLEGFQVRVSLNQCLSWKFDLMISYMKQELNKITITFGLTIKHDRILHEIG